MFRNIVSSTPLTTPEAGLYFQNIAGNMCGSDNSFVATLRALVAPRMGEADFLTYDYRVGEHPYNANKEDIPQRISRNLGLISNCNYIWLVNLDRDEDFEAINDYFETYTPSYKKLEKVTDFFRKSMKVVCFVNQELKNVILFTVDINLQKYHYLQCGIFAFLPWYFNPEDGVSELEMELINSLREKTPDHYMQCLQTIASGLSFRETNIKNRLKGFETRVDEKTCSDIQIYIRDVIVDIENYNSRISDLLRKKDDYEIRLLGLEQKIANAKDNGSELQDYFLANKNLYLNSVNGNNLTFSTWGYVEYYDEDMCEGVLDNPSSYVYKHANDWCTDEEMRELMSAIFLEKKLKMKLCATYTLGLTGNVRAVGGATYSYDFNDCYPNPHTDKYECMGNYTQIINQILLNHDYIGAVEQCVASCKSLNFGDSTVMRCFMNMMWMRDTTVNNKCIELPDGTIVDPIGAVEWLRTQKETSYE